jgi:hypothetical protein
MNTLIGSQLPFTGQAMSAPEIPVIRDRSTQPRGDRADDVIHNRIHVYIVLSQLLVLLHVCAARRRMPVSATRAVGKKLERDDFVKRNQYLSLP